MCSKGKATFGPIFDQVLQTLINTLGPQCTIVERHHAVVDRILEMLEEKPNMNPQLVSSISHYSQYSIGTANRGASAFTFSACDFSSGVLSQCLFSISNWPMIGFKNGFSSSILIK